MKKTKKMQEKRFHKLGYTGFHKQRMQLMAKKDAANALSGRCKRLVCLLHSGGKPRAFSLAADGKRVFPARSKLLHRTGKTIAADAENVKMRELLVGIRHVNREVV